MNDSTLLDRVLDGDPVPDDALTQEVERLIALARTLSEETEAVPIQMRDEARSALRASLLHAAAERRAAPPPLLTRLRERLTATGERLAYSARAASAGGLAAAVLSGGGVAMAADASLPGDPFYGLKLAVEDMSMAFDDPGAARGDALLSRAEGRIQEAARSLDAGATTSAAAALRLADEYARDGAHEMLSAYLETSDTQLLDDLDGWVVTTVRRLALLPAAEDDAAVALQDLRTTLDRIDQRVEVLASGACTSCKFGVHDDTTDPQDSARGVEADGSPPVPPTRVDLSVIPPADEPFRACPCTPTGSTPSPVPSPADGDDEIQPTEQDLPPAAEPADQADPDGPDEGGGDPADPEGDTGSLPVPVPDSGPVTEPLPDPVAEPIEEVIDELPDPDPPVPLGPGSG